MKRLLLLTLSCLLTISVMASPITQEQARQQAAKFLSKKKIGGASSPRLTSVRLSEAGSLADGALYAFNVGDGGGFVIVSSDDCVGDPVLGYADEGSLSLDALPDNLCSWLQAYAEQIGYMKSHGISNSQAATRAADTPVRQAVSPMLTCTWNQGEPYNAYCPYLEISSGNVKLSVTGCVATAAAQVLYYHGKHLNNKTTTSEAIPAYTPEINYTIVTWANEDIQATIQPILLQKSL